MFVRTLTLAAVLATPTLAKTSLVKTTLASDSPNIVVILADDFGVGDIAALDEFCAIPTPHLDRLVAEGRVFTDAHSPSAVCSPTRYGLLTGRYSWRTSLQEWVLASYEPPLIAAARPTLPGFLRDHGYHTSCVGKWHLGWDWPGPQPSQRLELKHALAKLEWDFESPIRGGPIERGFDHYFGTHVPNFPPFTFMADDRILVQPTERYAPMAADETDGVVLPTSFRGCPIAPGWRFSAILPELTRRAVEQVQTLAARQEPFFLYFSLTSPHEPVSPSSAFAGRSGIAPIADFLMETDWAAGQVLEAIDAAGIAENTLVVFTADNGHSHYTGWEALTKAGHHPSGPYRGHKGDVWEGGHRVPLIARWPTRVASGTRSQQLVSLTDLFATCADLLEVPLPEDGAEDSLSFLHSLVGDESSARTTAVQHSNHGEFAYRQGPWKLVYRNVDPDLAVSRGKPRIAELYHLARDVAESHDLAAEHPEVVEELTEALRATVQSGSSRPGVRASNDADVHFEITQGARWR